MHGGFRRGARLAQATGRVMGTLKCVWACFCIRSSYLRSLYRVFDDHSIPSGMPPVGPRLARTHPRALVYGLSTSQFLAVQQHTLCNCPACRLEVNLSR